MTTTDALLPCPFCGSAAIDAQGWASTDSTGPACDDCGASAGCVSASASENIAAWNRRAGLAHITALTAERNAAVAEVGQIVAWLRKEAIMSTDTVRRRMNGALDQIEAGAHKETTNDD